MDNNSPGQDSVKIDHDQDVTANPVISSSISTSPTIPSPSPVQPSTESIPLVQELPKDYDSSKYFFDTSEDVKPSETISNQNIAPTSPVQNPNVPIQPLGETIVDQVSNQPQYNFDTTPEPPRNDSQLNNNEIFKPSYTAPSEAQNQAEELPIPTANTFTNDEIPMEPVKTNNKIKWKIPVIAGATIILLGAGIFTYSALKPVGFKQFTLLNKGSRYTFNYYSDSILGTNLNTNNNQLTGNNKNLTSVAVSPIEKYTSCDQVEVNAKIVGTVSYKNSKYNICGTNQDKFTVFQANNQNIILEIYSDNKTTTISQSLINKVFASLKTN